MFIDTHAHLQDKRFASDRPSVGERAFAAGVTRIINISYDLPSSRVAIELAERDRRLWAAVGVHPHDAREVGEAELTELAKLAEHPRVVAVGETGLDYFRDLSPRPAQRWLFRATAAIAEGLRKPLIVHTRESSEDVLAILAELRPTVPVVMHCFSGSREFGQECVRRGYYLGVGGPVTYPKSEVLREIIATVPEGRLLLETDCPYLPPQQHRGDRNEPAYVPLIAARVAQVRGVSVEEVARFTTAAAERLFGLPPG
jgi:TatD DNase family protein